MFKKSMAVLALTASMMVPSMVHAASKAELDEAVCEARAELARQIMIVRQQGYTKDEVEGSVAAENRYMVTLAYNAPVVETPQQKTAMTIAMGKVEYEDCQAGK